MRTHPLHACFWRVESCNKSICSCNDIVTNSQAYNLSDIWSHTPNNCGYFQQIMTVQESQGLLSRKKNNECSLETHIINTNNTIKNLTCYDQKIGVFRRGPFSRGITSGVFFSSCIDSEILMIGQFCLILPSQLLKINIGGDMDEQHYWVQHPSTFYQMEVKVATNQNFLLVELLPSCHVNSNSVHRQFQVRNSMPIIART